MNKKKNYLRIVLFVVFSLLIVGSIVFYILTRPKKLSCDAPEGNITLTYNSKNLLGYKSRNLPFDLDAAKEYVSDVGVDEYLKEFKLWFIENSSGSCDGVDKLTCLAPEGKASIYYDDDGIITVETENLEFDLASAKAQAKEIGINKYLSEFRNWFKENSSGECK
jgi:hypothetical protein